jgi:hypothetical protein
MSSMSGCSMRSSKDYLFGDRKSASACRSSRSRCRRRRAQSSRDRNGRACRDGAGDRASVRHIGRRPKPVRCTSIEPDRKQPWRQPCDRSRCLNARPIPSMSPAVCSIEAFQPAAISLRSVRKGSNRGPGVKAPETALVSHEDCFMVGTKSGEGRPSWPRSRHSMFPN